MDTAEKLARLTRPRIIDISQPISSKTACFPGDVPFSREVTLTYEQSQVVNLTAIKMSPHVGTHADSPIHLHGDMAALEEMAGQMPLAPFVGSALVVDLSPHSGPILAAELQAKLPSDARLPQRILFRTRHQIRFDTWESDYSYFALDLIDFVAQRGVKLIALDTPSVDETSSKELAAHNRLLHHQMFWLENLDLTGVEPGTYFLVALPLKLMEAEASPVRAVLLDLAEGA
ncbi:MAG TPA: cyclase family protein [Planktothrix sp.]|jgi:arylformamidase